MQKSLYPLSLMASLQPGLHSTQRPGECAKVISLPELLVPLSVVSSDNAKSKSSSTDRNERRPKALNSKKEANDQHKRDCILNNPWSIGYVQ